MKLYEYRESPTTQMPNPSPANLPEAPPSGARELGAAIAGVGQAIGENVLQRAQLEHLVEQSRQAVQAAKLFTNLDAQAQEMLRNPDTSMPASTYQKNMQDALQQSLTEGVKQFGDERYRNAVLADGTIKIRDYGNKGWIAANTKLTDAMRADAHVQAEESAKRYALTPDALQRLDLVTRTTDLYTGLANAGVFSQQEAQAAIEKFLRGAEHGDAVTQMQADPGAFLLKLHTRTTDSDGKTISKDFPNLTPEQDFALSTTANALLDQRTRANEKAYKQNYETAISDLTSAARNKTLGLPELEVVRKALRMKEEDYTKLWNVINDTKEPASNPIMLRQMELAVRSAQPTVTKAQLAGAYGPGGLNTADYDRLDNKLTENLRHLDALTERGETRIGADHAQAEQLLRTALQTTSPLEALNQEGQQAYSLALDELTRRSKRFGGAEDPISVYREILPKYQAILSSAVEGRISVMRSTVRHKTAKELQQAYQGRPQDQTFFDALRTLRDIDSMEKAISQMPKKPKGEDFGRETKK